MSFKTAPGCKCCRTGCIYVQDDILPENYPGPYPQALDVGVWEVHAGTWQVENTYTTVLHTDDAGALVTLRQPIAELPAQIHGFVHWNPFAENSAVVGVVWGFLDTQNYYYVTAEWTHADAANATYRVLFRAYQVIAGVEKQLGETMASEDPFEGGGINLYIWWDGVTAWINWYHEQTAAYSGDPLANAPRQFFVVTPDSDTLGKRIGYIAKVGNNQTYFSDGIGSVDTFKQQRLQGGAASYVGTATKCIYREGCEYFSDAFGWGPYTIAEFINDEVYDTISGPWEIVGTPGNYSLELFNANGVIKLRTPHPKPTKYFRTRFQMGSFGLGLGDTSRLRMCVDMIDEDNYTALQFLDGQASRAISVVRRVAGSDTPVPLTDDGPGSGSVFELCYGAGGAIYFNEGATGRRYSATSSPVGGSHIGFAFIGDGSFGASFLEWLRHPDQPDAEPQFPDACGGCGG